MTKKPKPVKPAPGNRIKSPMPRGVSTDNERPIFSLNHHGGNYCITDCATNEKAAFAERLYQLSQQTWLGLKLAPREGQGFEILPRYAIKGAAIPRSITEEVEFIVFRFHSGNGRIVGYRDDAVFHIIWIDPKLTLYDH